MARSHKSMSLVWEKAQSQLWFIPSVLVLCAIVLAVVSLYLDFVLETDFDRDSMWMFTGSGEGARTILSVIAGSLITVAAVAFSVTMIAIQQASTQYTPRILRNFTRDRGNQVVLGTYIATFAYALIVLRQIRESNADVQAFVPTISIFVIIILALISLGMLVYFIHHASESLQVEQVLGNIQRELEHQIGVLFPEGFGKSSRDPTPGELEASISRLEADTKNNQVIRSLGPGYLRRIDQDSLLKGLPSSDDVAFVPVQMGDYIRSGTALLWLARGTKVEGSKLDELRNAFQLDRSRSIYQDPQFGFKQMVDIAVRALSPGVNDPSTAEQAIDCLSASISKLLMREMPSPHRVVDGARVVFRVPAFRHYVAAAFGQIRRAARDDFHVTMHLIDTLDSLAIEAPNAERAEVIREEIAAILPGLSQTSLDREDQEQVRKRISRALARKQAESPRDAPEQRAEP